MKENFWIGGKNTVFSALENEKRKINHVVTSKEYPLLKKYEKTINIKKVNKSFFNKIFKENDFQHQYIAANINLLSPKLIKNEISKIKKIIILDNISDPRNLGAIIRTCVAFDFRNIIIQEKHFKATSPQMYKTASGAMEKVNIFKVVNINNTVEFLKKNNFWINGLDANASLQIEKKKDWPEKNAFVLGSEEKGISKLLERNCDNLYKISISENIESLNVSNAASAALAIFNSNTIILD